MIPYINDLEKEKARQVKVTIDEVVSHIKRLKACHQEFIDIMKDHIEVLEGVKKNFYPLGKIKSIKKWHEQYKKTLGCR